ncbi:MAG: hypothetical protein KIS76_18325 [Pyrinomonadaceae bacterium]|nr:hypothetical protein [Pyrinomonadaceae bacterium]
MIRSRLLILAVLLISAQSIFAQKETGSRGTVEKFDIASFQTPKGWQKELLANAVQFGAENTDGGICIITLFKSLPASSDSKANFDAAWETIVKETVAPADKPEMQPSISENGWTAETGIAVYESDGKKGAAMLITMTGGSKMVNILVLTNTDAFQQTVEQFLGSIDLEKIPQKTSSETVQKPQTSIQPSGKTQSAKKTGFKFNETNFDDGWTSIEQEDWVEVVKGNIKVLIHYPKEGTVFPADPEPLTNAAWNILVAPRYSNLKNYKTAYITTYNRPYLGMGTATDNATGKSKFVLLFRQGNVGWIEFVAPDKNSFVQQFKFDPEAIKWDSESDLLIPLIQMANYNKFAIAESDFNGTWTSDFSVVQQLYNVYTGNYAGMNINQSKEEFIFGNGNSYNWKLLVVNGMVGNMKFANVSSAGKFSVLNNWQIQFSKIESGPKTYNAHWSCIKGARLLNLLDAKNPGSGIYSVYGKK